MNEDSSNKRIFNRLEETFNLRYKIIKPALQRGEPVLDSKEYFVITKDISAGGLSFISPKPIPANTILEIKIELLNSDKPVECIAKVLRAIKLQESGEEFYNISVLFLDLSSADRERLMKYVTK